MFVMWKKREENKTCGLVPKKDPHSRSLRVITKVTVSDSSVRVGAAVELLER